MNLSYTYTCITNFAVSNTATDDVTN